MMIGCAIISVDGYIADPTHSMAALQHPYDFSLLQARLQDEPGICVMGGITHRRHPNVRERQRYILSRCQQAGPQTDHFFATETDLLTAIGRAQVRRFYVLGGSSVYTAFGSRQLYTDFFLSIVPITLGTGIPLNLTQPFSGAGPLMRGWGLAREKRTYQTPELEIWHYTR